MGEVVTLDDSRGRDVVSTTTECGIDRINWRRDVDSGGSGLRVEE